MTRILIAEDEERIVTFLERGLRGAGYSTHAVHTGPDALGLARDDQFELLLLDLGLPGLDGQEVLRQVRARGDRLPIIVLTARDSLGETVTGFDNGADDYLTTPFQFEELLVRIRARLRPDVSAEAAVLTAGRVSLDVRTRRARVGNREVDLSAREFALATTFLRHPGQVLSREQLLSHVWGYDFSPDSNVVDVYVRYLRKKLGPEVITTVRGMGYRLDDSPPAVEDERPA